MWMSVARELPGMMTSSSGASDPCGRRAQEFLVFSFKKCIHTQAFRLLLSRVASRERLDAYRSLLSPVFASRVSPQKIFCRDDWHAALPQLQAHWDRVNRYDSNSRSPETVSRWCNLRSEHQLGNLRPAVIAHRFFAGQAAADVENGRRFVEGATI